MNKKLKPTLLSYQELVSKQLQFGKLQNVIQIIQRNYNHRYDKVYDSVKFKEIMLESLSVQREYQHALRNTEVEDQTFLPLILSK